MTSPVIRQLKRALRWAPWAIAVLTLAGLAGLLWPTPDWIPPRLEAPRSVEPPPFVPPADINSLAVIWQRDLRQAVADAPTSAPVVAPEPDMGVRLVGTAVETQQRYGVFQLADNRTLVRGVGGRVGEFEVLGIERGQAKLRGRGREYQLRVPWFERMKPDPSDDRHE